MDGRLTLVTRKPCFGLPTACPNGFLVYFYLKFARAPFDLYFHSTFPDSGLLVWMPCSLAMSSLRFRPYLKLLGHGNLIKYTEKHSKELTDADLSSSAVPLPKADPLSSVPKQGGFADWNSKPKSKPKREKREEEKKLRRRAKYFLAAQLVAVLVFLSLLGGSDDAEVELEENEESLDYSD